MEPSEIASIVKKIAHSDRSVDAYCREPAVPFGRAQYCRYKARLAAGGLDGRADGRGRGNHRKLTADVEGVIRGVHRGNPRRSLQAICASWEPTLGIRVDRSTVSRFLRAIGEQIEWPRPGEPARLFTSSGGFEIIGAPARHLGWANHTAEVILQERDRFRKTAAFRQARRARDRKGRNAGGQFTGEYNRRADVWPKRCASGEEKRAATNSSRLAVVQAGEVRGERKCLGILALPLITLNGTTRSANGPPGKAREHFWGYNYHHDPRDKFLRELKSLGVSERRLRDQVAFGQAHWRKVAETPAGLPFLGYYVDGHTTPLWSEKRGTTTRAPCSDGSWAVWNR